MIRVGLSAIAYCLLVNILAWAGDAGAVARLQGKWTPTTPGPVEYLSFQGKKFTLALEGDKVYKGTFTVKPSKVEKQPSQIDLVVTSGPVKKAVGRRALGIYKLEGASLKWCSNTPGEPKRPMQFQSTGDTILSFELEKAK